MRYLKRIFLEIFRPLFQYFKKRKPDYFKTIIDDFDDPYLSGMIRQFNFFHRIIYKPYFEKVRVNQDEVATIKKITSSGPVVYIMRQKGQLEYSYFNHLFLKEDLPLVRFANKAHTLFWRPLREIFRCLLARMNIYYTQGPLTDPYKNGTLENLILDGKSALINFKVSRELLFGSNEDALNFTVPLIKAAQKSEKPITLMTQQFLYDLHPEKEEKSLMDLMFGEKSNPGPIRKLIMFLVAIKQKATVKFGEPFDLSAFVKENSQLDEIELTKKLKDVLLARLRVERRSITGPALKSPEWFLDQMWGDAYFKEKLEKLAEETGTSKESLQKESHKIFKEIAAKINYSYIDFYDWAIRWMSTNIFDGLDIDKEGLAKIKAIAGKTPVVLVPCHKSHIDYLLLSYIFYNYDLTLPHVCAGINLKFWPASHFIRRAGGFFIRRTLGGNKLYKLVLETYLKILVGAGYSTEFFIEGTRSRTGKLLKPKTGILSMLVKAFMRGASSDLYFVPININYERILEEGSYVKEIKGKSKEKENVAGIIKARKSFKKKYGKVFIQFADPISLKDFLHARGIEQSPNTDIKKEINELAYTITYNINKVSTVNTASLVATAALMYDGKGIPEHYLLEQPKLLRRYLDFKEARLSDVLRLNEEWAIKETIQKMVTEGSLTKHEDFTEKFYTITESQRMSLDYHKNNCLHFFISQACFLKIILPLAAQNKEVPLNEVLKRYEQLKTLLRHDFTFSQRSDLKSHILKIVQFYSNEGLILWDEQREILSINAPLTNPLFSFFENLIDNYFESYLVTLLYIKHVAFVNLDKRNVIVDILEKGKTLSMKGDIRYPESLSRFNIENALLVFQDVGLIKIEATGLLSRVFDEQSITQWENLIKNLLHKPTVNEKMPQLSDNNSSDLPSSGMIAGSIN